MPKWWPSGLDLIDFDNDGVADLMVNGKYFLCVLRGSGDGKFTVVNAARAFSIGHIRLTNSSSAQPIDGADEEFDDQRQRRYAQACRNVGLDLLSGGRRGVAAGQRGLS